MKVKVRIYKKLKIFKWEFIVRVPDFLNPWELSGSTVVFGKPPSKEDIVNITWSKK